MGRTRIWLLILTLGGYGWRLHGLIEESLWRDEVDAVYFALRDLPETLSMFVSAAQNGALYFLSLRPWLQLVGSSEFALRYPSAMAGVLCIPLMYKVCQELWSLDTAFFNKLAPLLATILFTVNPYQVWYSQEGKMYTIIVAQSLLASWLWLRGIETAASSSSEISPWRYWSAYLVIMSLSIYTHLLMVLLIPIHLLWFLVAWPNSKQAWKGYGGALAGLTLPYLPMLWWQWDMLTSANRRTGYNFVPFDDVVTTLLDNHSQGFMAAQEAIWYAPLYFLALAGLLMGPWEVGWRRYSTILVWLFGPILLIYGLSLRQPVFVDRYIIWIGPAAVILLTLGLGVVWNNGSILARPLVWGLTIYIGAFWVYAGWEQKQLGIKYDLRSAVTTIAAQRHVDELLILQIPHMEYSYRYYSSDLGAAPFTGSTERLGSWTGGLWTNNGLPVDQARVEVENQMQTLTAGADTVWVLRSEVEMWDQRYLMDEWLESRGERLLTWDYHGSQVRQYKLNR